MRTAATTLATTVKATSEYAVNIAVWDATTALKDPQDLYNACILENADEVEATRTANCANLKVASDAKQTELDAATATFETAIALERMTAANLRVTWAKAYLLGTESSSMPVLLQQFAE